MMMNSAKPQRLTLAAIGCGGRTRTYVELAAAQPDRYLTVAAADPNTQRLEQTRALTRNPDFRGFADDVAILAEPKLADIMIIGTQDAHHVEPCIAAMEKGYDILLEKPIATKVSDIVRLEEAAQRCGRKVLVCHVLRYAPFYRKVHEIIQSGALGRLISLNALEGVDPWHQGHSFVRGNWAVTENCTPMNVAKSCHDMDVLHWLAGRPCRSVSSYGALTWFTAQQAPDGAPARCTDGCPVGDTCLWNAHRYAQDQRDWLQWVHPDPQAHRLPKEEIIEWLKTSPYGRCVYRCDNTAVDHQVVAMEFEEDITATFTMTAFARGRSIDLYGTEAVLRGSEWLRETMGCDIVVERHRGGVEKISIDVDEGGYGGHGGGDPGLMNALYVEMTRPAGEEMSTSLSVSVESHLMAFAAERSRLKGEAIPRDQFR